MKVVVERVARGHQTTPTKLDRKARRYVLHDNGHLIGYTLQFTYQFDPSLSPSFLKAHTNPPPLTIFTSKLESLVGLEFISLSPLHPLVNLCKEISPEMKTEIEKQV